MTCMTTSGRPSPPLAYGSPRSVTTSGTDVQSSAREVGSLIDEASRSIRSLAAQLAPAVLNELGIAAALDWLGEEMERTFSLGRRR